MDSCDYFNTYSCEVFAYLHPGSADVMCSDKTVNTVTSVVSCLKEAIIANKMVGAE
jgi:hypothetical protein